MNTLSDLNSEAHALFEWTQALRRDIHRHPELGFREERTASLVARELTAMGLEVSTGVGKTGVVALLEGKYPGPVILLRSDMDALPIVEETGAEYASENQGVMHACGHDGHIAALLTAARLLTAHREDLRGTVKFVFQPAEEGLGGAPAMVRDGVLTNPKPDLTIACHLWNERPVGWLALTPGPLMAGSEAFFVTVKGKGGHGAVPQESIDPILAAAHIITAVQGIVSRNVSPMQSAVISVTRIRGGETHNVIPSKVEMAGTIRTFDADVRQTILERLKGVVEGVAGGLGCSAHLDIRPLTPAVVNDASVVAKLNDLALRIFPDLHIDHQYQTMISEDVSYFMGDIPGCFMLVGSSNPERGLNYCHHHPRFDFDEAVLPHAAALMAGAVLGWEEEA
jgi:amidohydrolase